jgi:glycosidase
MVLSRISKLLPLSLAFLSFLGCPALAAEVSVDRIDPPLWWSAAEPQELSLLIEGAGLSGAAVRTVGGPVRVLGVEEGIEGRALFVEVAIAAGAAPGLIGIEVDAGGHRLRRDWELRPRPEYRPRPIGPDDVIYLVMPDRFANGDPGNDEPEGPERMLDRRDPHAYHGGDFRGLRGRLPYLVDLGVTSLWLTPVYRPAPRWFEVETQGKSRRFADFHGYSPVDFFDTNPRFGTPDDYQALVAEAHRLGLKVIQDQVIGYVGPRHRWVEHPPAPDWFHGPIANPPPCTFRFDALVNPYATDAERRGVTDGWFFGILPDLDTRNPRVRRYAFQQSLWWATRFEADGLRLDTYPMVERDFWRDWSRRLRSARPGTWVVGEAWVTDPAELCFFQGGRTGWDGIDPGVEAVFDFPLNLAIQEVFSGKAPASRLARVLGRDGLYPRPDRLVTFLDNHDTPRLAAVPGVTPARLRLVAAFLLTTRGVPQMTWGDELGLPGHMDDRRDFPGGFPGDPRDAFEAAGRALDERKSFDAWRALLRLRRDSPALRRGRLTDLAATETAYVYLREHEGERVLVALNLGGKPADIRIPTDRWGTAAPGDRVYGEGRTSLGERGIVIELPAESVGVYRTGLTAPSAPAAPR